MPRTRLDNACRNTFSPHGAALETGMSFPIQKQFMTPARKQPATGLVAAARAMHVEIGRDRMAPQSDPDFPTQKRLMSRASAKA